MKLIGSALSPYATRVLLAARFKGIELKIEPIPLGARSAEFLALNPIGKVPVLVDGELALPESTVIVSYLEDRMPAPPLFPGTAAQRANIRLLVRLIDAYSVPSFAPFLAKDRGAINTACERIERSLQYLDHFRLDGPFASGDAFSAADCALIPFFHVFESLDSRFDTFQGVRKRPRLHAWWSRTRETELGVYARAEIDRAVAELLDSRR